MDSPLKQRLIGAAVLVALAVIFLPMLVQGPAPDSGVSDVPLNVPDAPASDYEVRDLPLVEPGAAPDGGAVGMDARPAGPAAGNAAAGSADADAVAPMPATQEPDAESSTAVPLEAPVAHNPDAAELAQPADAEPEPAARLPATTAGGDYAVGFGSFSTAAAADKVIASLRAARLPGYRESATVDRNAVQRVRIGPYATRADAEVARQQALRVRDDISAQVVVLDADAASAVAIAASKPAATKPVVTTPAQPPAVAPAPVKPPAPAAAQTGFAVQVGAFTRPADATTLRDKLRAAGFSAFTEAVATDKGTLTRVRVGPVASHGEADQLKTQVRAKLGIDGIVRPHP